MPDRPTDSADAATAPEVPARSLSEILAELAQLSQSQQGDASEMRSAVSELSRSLARLFEMIRSDRHEQRARIGQLERELTAMRLQLAELGVEPAPAPAPNDFDQLRAAAERLRLRTQQLVRESAESASAEPAATPSVADDTVAVDANRSAHEDELIGAGLGPGIADSAPATADEASAPVFRVIDGAVPSAPEPAVDAPAPAPELDVESDLPVAQAEAMPVPQTEAPAAEVATQDDEVTQDDEAPQPTPARRPEPVPVAPRPAAKRSFGLRRRRVDARKLTGVEPTAALGSMVAAVNTLWTAGCPVNLVVAFTDGGAVRIVGGDRLPLRLEEVEPGTPARCTVTATRRQLIPLFGRLELTDEESAPLIHGSRRDADLLVGWFDRAQRLPVAPL